MFGGIGDIRNIDLNTASKEVLERIGGIGGERTEQIISQRPFANWEDLKQRVPGVDDKVINMLQQAGVKIGGTEASGGGGGR